MHHASSPVDPWDRHPSRLDWQAFRSIYEVFLRTVERHGERPALLTMQGVRYTWNEFATAVARLAASFLSVGLARGDRVAIIARNRPEWVITDLAALSVGAADVPIYPSLPVRQMVDLLADSGARVAVVADAALLDGLLQNEALLPQLQHAIFCDGHPRVRPVRIRWHAWEDFCQSGHAVAQQAVWEGRQASATLSDIASIVYTSGTTGNPKGVLLSHGNLLCSAADAHRLIELSERDVELSFLPLSHVFERMAFYVCMMVGATVAFADSIETLPDDMLKVRPTLLVSVPRLFEKMQGRILSTLQTRPRWQQALFRAAVQLGIRRRRCEAAGQPVPLWLTLASSLVRPVLRRPMASRLGGRIRYLIAGGAPLNRTVGEFLDAVGLTVQEGYGLTETAPLLTGNPQECPHFGTAGLPFPDVELKLADDGEILVRGPNVMSGYHNRPAETAEAFDTAGFYRTGDLGRFDSAGYLSITGRKKDLIVLSTGKKVAPQPIEMALERATGIQQAMLVGDGRPFVAALVVPSADCGNQALDVAVHSVNEALARYEQIKRFAVLPRELSEAEGELTPTLKFKRRVVLEHFQSLVDGLYQTTEPGHPGSR